jgi:hypothetical protein
MRLLVFVVMCMKCMWMSIRNITLFRVLRGEGVLATSKLLRSFLPTTPASYSARKTHYGDVP